MRGVKCVIQHIDPVGVDEAHIRHPRQQSIDMIRRRNHQATRRGLQAKFLK